MIGARDLEGSVVVIAGASSGIGRATALAFADHRAHLVLAARRAPALEEVARECTGRGAAAIAVPTDVGDADAVQRLVDRALERFGRVDVWVQAASLLIAGRLEDHPDEEVEALVATNVTGAVLGARAALRVFRVQGSGVLVLVSSLLGLFPSPLAPVYGASKFAVRGLGLTLRRSVADLPDVHVCTVLPGPVDTPIFQRAANHTGRRLRAIPPAYAPERLAAAIVGCARRPRRQVTAGLLSYAQLVGHRLAPRPVEWLVGEWARRLITSRAPGPDSPGAVLGAVPDGGTVHGGWRRGRVRRRIGERVGTALAHRGAHGTSDVASSTTPSDAASEA